MMVGDVADFVKLVAIVKKKVRIRDRVQGSHLTQAITETARCTAFTIYHGHKESWRS